MNVGDGVNDSSNNQSIEITQCDQGAVSSEPKYQPTPTPSPTPCTATTAQLRWCKFHLGYFDPETCTCQDFSSPILVDTLGDGFALTDASHGVSFDLDSDGAPENISWTAGDSDDAWLALDRDGDGLIADGRELFGNFTEQPAPPAGVARSGFNALAEYDKLANGGNGDGLIDSRDAVFSGLRLWRDANHDGVSQPAELQTLAGLGLQSVALDYKESKRTDEYGNRFRYRAKLVDARGAQLGRWAWDVFLTRGR
jgi:hypothetical protein